MNYYNIGRTNDLSIIGHYPQTERTKRIGYHIEDTRSEKNVHPDIFPNFDPKYGLDLHNESKETDILDSGSLDFGFVVSLKLKLILEKFNLPPHKFYSIDVFNSQKKYFWFHYITEIGKYLDFFNVEIEVYKNRPPFKVEEIKTFESIPEMVAFKRNLPFNLAARYKKITLNKQFPKFDLFEITGIQYFTLISKNLKDELIYENITGLEIIQFNKLFVTD